MNATIWGYGRYADRKSFCFTTRNGLLNLFWSIMKNIHIV